MKNYTLYGVFPSSIFGRKYETFIEGQSFFMVGGQKEAVENYTRQKVTNTEKLGQCTIFVTEDGNKYMASITR